MDFARARRLKGKAEILGRCDVRDWSFGFRDLDAIPVLLALCSVPATVKLSQSIETSRYCMSVAAVPIICSAEIGADACRGGSIYLNPGIRYLDSVKQEVVGEEG